MAGFKPAAPNTDIEAMRATLKAGVQVVSAPQLFPTPRELAARMVELAGTARGMRVLEPNAGTGRLLAAIRWATGGGAVRAETEISARLCDALRVREEGADTRNCDFLKCSAEQLGGLSDRFAMNPPLGTGADSKHITHAPTASRDETCPPYSTTGATFAA